MQEESDNEGVLEDSLKYELKTNSKNKTQEYQTIQEGSKDVAAVKKNKLKSRMKQYDYKNKGFKSLQPNTKIGLYMTSQNSTRPAIPASYILTPS